MDTSSARDLVVRCRDSRDGGAWEAFRNRFEDTLRGGVRRAFRLAGRRPRPETVDDLVQETYCRLVDRRARALRGCRARDEAGIAAYLKRVAERVALDHLRARATAKRGRNRVDSLDQLLEKGAEGVVAVGPLAERRLRTGELERHWLAACRRAAGRGGKLTVEVLGLALFQGLTSREISDRLGRRLTPNGIDSLLYRARRRLAAQGLTLPRRAGASAVPSVPT